MTTISVRAAAAADLSTLVQFQLQMAQETEGKSLDPMRLRAGVQTLLGDPARGRYLLAVRGEVILGCLMLTYEWSDWRNGWFWWLQSVYTAPEARGQGVFRALYDGVLAEARARADVCGLRLYVEQDNQAAQGVYVHLGMQASQYRFYELELASGPEQRKADGLGSIVSERNPPAERR